MKIGDVCILDINNELDLKEYRECIVRIVAKAGFRRYMVIPVSPVIHPSKLNSYICKPFVVNKRWLTKTSMDEKIVIRTEGSAPVITVEDRETIKEAIKYVKERNVHCADKLTKFLLKLEYYAQFKYNDREDEIDE